MTRQRERWLTRTEKIENQLTFALSWLHLGAGYGGAGRSAYATVLDSTHRDAQTLPGGVMVPTMEGRPSGG